MRRFISSLLLLSAACGERDRETSLRSGPELEVVSSTVGAEGGVVTLGSGPFVGVPANALASPAELSIEELAMADLTTLPSGLSLAGQPYAFLPHGQTFAQDVTIALPYSGTPSGLSVLRLDDENDTEWERVEGVGFDDSKVIFESTHFSVYVTARASEADHDAGHDAGHDDAATDGGLPDAADASDSGLDSGTDGAIDDGAVDGGPADVPDSAVDGGPTDASDSGFDASDGSFDAGFDGGPADVGPDGGVDGGVDGGPTDAFPPD